MTKLEDHLEGIINIFHQYSVRTGHYDTLTKCELKKLITTELANTIKVGNALPFAHPLLTLCVEPEGGGCQALEQDGRTRTVLGLALA